MVVRFPGRNKSLFFIIIIIFSYVNKIQIFFCFDFFYKKKIKNKRVIAEYSSPPNHCVCNYNGSTYSGKKHRKIVEAEVEENMSILQGSYFTV